MKSEVWLDEFKVIPEIYFNKSNVRIEKVRDFKHLALNKYEISYKDININLDKVKKTYFCYVPFSKWMFFVAHIFLSFEFEDGQFLCVSTEVRKNKEEEFSILKTIYKKYDLFYVIGTERDIIGLRANFRNEKTYMFPLKMNREDSGEILKSILQSSKKTHTKPERYKFISDNCASNIIRNIRKSHSNKLFTFFCGELWPGFAYWSVFRRGLIDSNLDYKKTKEKCYVNNIAKESNLDDNFSKNIRKDIYRLF